MRQRTRDKHSQAQKRPLREEVSVQAAAQDAELSEEALYHAAARLHQNLQAAPLQQEGLCRDRVQRYLQEARELQARALQSPEIRLHTEDRQCQLTMRQQKTDLQHTPEEAAVQAARAEEQSTSHRPYQEVHLHRPRPVHQASTAMVEAESAEAAQLVEETPAVRVAA